MKVKASQDFQFYRLSVLRVPKKGAEDEYEYELPLESFRALQAGQAVDVDEKLYNMYKNIFEVVEPPKKKGAN